MLYRHELESRQLIFKFLDAVEAVVARVVVAADVADLLHTDLCQGAVPGRHLRRPDEPRDHDPDRDQIEPTDNRS